MKKTIRLLSLILVMALFAFSLVACIADEPEDNTPKTEQSSVIEVGNQASGKVIKIVVGGADEKVYSVDFSSIEITEGVFSVVKYLASEGKLTYKSDDTGYGAFLTEVGELKQDTATGTYIYLYTSVEADADVSEWASTKEWEGNTLTSSGLGVTDMTVENGAIIYVGTVSYGA